MVPKIRRGETVTTAHGRRQETSGKPTSGASGPWWEPCRHPSLSSALSDTTGKGAVSSSGVTKTLQRVGYARAEPGPTTRRRRHRLWHYQFGHLLKHNLVCTLEWWGEGVIKANLTKLNGLLALAPQLV